MDNQKCCICSKEPKWPVVDGATGFSFCWDEYNECRLEFKKYSSGSPWPVIADWLRAIASVMDKHA